MRRAFVRSGRFARACAGRAGRDVRGDSHLSGASSPPFRRRIGSGRACELQDSRAAWTGRTPSRRVSSGGPQGCWALGRDRLLFCSRDGASWGEGVPPEASDPQKISVETGEIGRAPCRGPRSCRAPGTTRAARRRPPESGTQPPAATPVSSPGAHSRGLEIPGWGDSGTSLCKEGERDLKHESPWVEHLRVQIRSLWVWAYATSRHTIACVCGEVARSSRAFVITAHGKLLWAGPLGLQPPQKGPPSLTPAITCDFLNLLGRLGPFCRARGRESLAPSPRPVLAISKFNTLSGCLQPRKHCLSGP